MTILVLSPTPDALMHSLGRAGLSARAVVEADPVVGLSRLEEGRWELVVLDAAFAGGGALELVEPLSVAGQRVLVVSAQPSLSQTLRALRAGAIDVQPLPVPVERLRQIAEASSGSSPVKTEPAGVLGGPAWVGQSPVLLDAFRSVVRLSSADVPILLWGEPGTGKGHLARIIHEQSGRSAGPFVNVNCGAVPEAMLESELFGHERGAFPGAYARRASRIARAHQGTLLLDELTEMSPRLQSRVVALLRTGEIEPQGASEVVVVDVRIVATVDAGHVDEPPGLHAELRNEFSGGVIHVPPLRERGEEDIRNLALYFMRTSALRYGRDVRAISDEAFDVLRRHTWPGNVRQLRGAIERAVLEAGEGEIHAVHLPAELRRTAGQMPSELSLSLADLEKRHILRVLEMTDGHLGNTSEILGIHRNTLRRKLISYGIEAE